MGSGGGIWGGGFWCEWWGGARGEGMMEEKCGCGVERAGEGCDGVVGSGWRD